jgi:hypothetical protein
VSFEAGTGVIRVRGSGQDIWGEADHGYFVSQGAVGDFQATVRVLAGPSETNKRARAGLMVRETLAPGSRNAYLFATAGMGLYFQWRHTANDATDLQGVSMRAEPGLYGKPRPSVQPGVAEHMLTVRLPLTLRVTRRRDTVTGEVSRDGRRFRPVGRWTFVPSLAERVEVGLAVTAHNVQQTSEARFEGLAIRRW